VGGYVSSRVVSRYAGSVSVLQSREKEVFTNVYQAGSVSVLQGREKGVFTKVWRGC
jgi:hypothetical protein